MSKFEKVKGLQKTKFLFVSFFVAHPLQSKQQHSFFDYQNNKENIALRSLAPTKQQEDERIQQTTEPSW